MSSSRVIKSSGCANPGVTEFSLREFGELETMDINDPPGKGFVPFAGVAESGARQVAHDEDADAEADGTATIVDETRLAELELKLRAMEEENLTRVKESFDKGLEEGQRIAERGLSNVFKSLRDAVAEVLALRDKILRESEEDLLKLSILVAQTVIRQEISHDRRILEKVVATALENSKEQEEIVIRLNPEDYKIVASHKQTFLQGIADRKTINLKADVSVSAGGCIVDTAMGEVDARLETQLEEIYRHMLGERIDYIGMSRISDNDTEQYAYDES